VPFALAMAAMVKRDWDGWVKPVLPWVALSTAMLATGFIMGGVWAYRVLGWGGYWGWDPVENGSLIPWLANVALLHGLLVQRASGNLRRTNLALAVTSFVLVVYASFLTRSGVLAQHSMHSFADEGLTGFLLAFLCVILLGGYGLLVFRLGAVSAPAERMEDVSRETVVFLGLLALVMLFLLVAVGMSMPLLQRAIRRLGSAEPSYYDAVSGPLAVLVGLLMGLAPLSRWGGQDPRTLLQRVLLPLALAAGLTAMVVVMGLRSALQAAVFLAAAFALATNAVGLVRGFRSGWRHGLASLAHGGVAVLLIGVVLSSGLGRSAGVVLRPGKAHEALGYRLTYEGIRPAADGHDRARIEVDGPGGRFTAMPSLGGAEGTGSPPMAPHIERTLTGDLYLSPLELLGREATANGPVWMAPGETWRSGGTTYTLLGLEPAMETVMRIVARIEVVTDGRHETLRPALEIDTLSSTRRSDPDCLEDGGEVSIVAADPMTGSVALEFPAAGAPGPAGLAVELSTKPWIGLVWLGAILMLVSVFLAMLRRAGEVGTEARVVGR
jgi:cytochrome c-type biogenesis protein CcmF